jgi:hypothetical protein
MIAMRSRTLQEYYEAVEAGNVAAVLALYPTVDATKLRNGLAINYRLVIADVMVAGATAKVEATFFATLRVGPAVTQPTEYEFRHTGMRWIIVSTRARDGVPSAKE